MLQLEQASADSILETLHVLAAHLSPAALAGDHIHDDPLQRPTRKMILGRVEPEA